MSDLQRDVEIVRALLDAMFLSRGEPVPAAFERIAAALNQQARVVEALRPLEEALARHDKAALADDHGKIAVAAHDLFDAARAALAAIKEKGNG